MARPIDQEIVVIEQTLLLTVPERRECAKLWGATWGSTRVGREAEGARGVG